MTPAQIRQAIEVAKANGDERRIARLTAQLELLCRIGAAWSRAVAHRSNPQQVT